MSQVLLICFVFLIFKDKDYKSKQITNLEYYFSFFAKTTKENETRQNSQKTATPTEVNLNVFFFFHNI